MSLPIVFLLSCIVKIQCEERKASLVILPPIVLGYDELYDEPKTTNAPKKIITKKKKKPKPRRERLQGKDKTDGLMVFNVSGNEDYEEYLENVVHADRVHIGQGDSGYDHHSNGHNGHGHHDHGQHGHGQHGHGHPGHGHSHEHHHGCKCEKCGGNNANILQPLSFVGKVIKKPCDTKQ